MNFFIAAGMVTILSILILLIFARKKMHLIWLSLPLPFIANPIKELLYFLLYKIFGVKEALNELPLWFIIGITGIGALIEEIVKILPLLLLMRVSVKIKGDKKSIYFLGLILGGGFGIGEAWLLSLPCALVEVNYVKGLKNLLMLLSSFGGERLIAIFIHVILTGIVAFAIAYGKPLRYLLVAVLFHFIINIPASLFQKGLLSQPVSGFLILVMFSFLVLIFFKINKKAKDLWSNNKEKMEVIYEKK